MDQINKGLGDLLQRNREIILDGVNRILSTTGYDAMDLAIVEEPINLESIKGANTTDI